MAPDPQRSVIEHLLFAACLEDAKYDAAEQAFAALVHNFFDWNEVRVTTIRELAEEISCLPDPTRAAQRIKEILQSVFETKYAFDLEELRKENLGPATEQLQKIKGATSFAVAYVMQVALGGHAIPVDAAAISVMEIPPGKTQETSSGERARWNARWRRTRVSVASLHQFAVDFTPRPTSPNSQCCSRSIRKPRVAETAQSGSPETPGQAAPSPTAPPAAGGYPKAEQKPKKAAAKTAAPSQGQAKPARMPLKEEDARQESQRAREQARQVRTRGKRSATKDCRKRSR